MRDSKKIKEYVNHQELDMEAIMKEFTNYILTIIKNSNYHFSNEDIEEIASDVFLVVWNNQNKLNGDKALAPYIAGVTKNLILKKEFYNKNRTTNMEPLENSLYDTNRLDIQYETIEKNTIIRNKLEKMREEDRNIFIYYYYNAKGMQEIAELLNINTRKVKSRLFRIRKKLKLELEKRGYSNERE